ncbi:MAG: 3'-5' exonuclease [Proteobacteria bacterium]|nr:3'-5' exonuclease [Pseudomonadota bacterium]MBU1964237.1 3'-5' exonuclease [Pseudomonadota bacterium]MBU4370375.1 3'-5' exonuclease [Pseudomonadota bacterium]MBU4583549.1 3'-5' exonuclease [Pseudomonadota bacterium]MCG2738943.1 3'-5' exonuclease [Syntrophaceae bacterium]
MYLFFDTETTGIPRNYKAPASDHRNWPRLVQIAWLLVDEEANEVASAEHIVKPDGFTIPQDAAKIHGITTEMAAQNGLDLKVILTAITPNINKASALVAHNIQFDEKILGAEFLRVGYTNLVESKQRKCTMQGATNYCCLPGPYGYKWPTLQELHMKLFNEPFEGVHRALVDVRACARCYFELKRLKVMA